MAWLVEHAPRPVRAPVELVARTVRDAVADRVIGLSAEVAFFTILALPPLLLAVVAALGFLPGAQGDAFVDGLTAASQRVFTDTTVDNLIEPLLVDVVEDRSTGVLSFGFAIAVISASRALRVVFTSVAIAYDLGGHRPSWAQRLYGLLVTIALLAVVPVFMPLLLAGPGLGTRLVNDVGLPTVLATVWPPAYWLAVAGGAVVAVAGLYHLAAPWWTPFRRDLPGAALAVATWVGSSFGLRVYAEQAFLGRDAFSIVAGPLVLLVWLYLLAFGVILGAELNAELERMFPSPEQQRAPASERLRRRLLHSSAAARLEQTLPDVLQGWRPHHEQGPPAEEPGEAARTGRLDGGGG